MFLFSCDRMAATCINFVLSNTFSKNKVVYCLINFFISEKNSPLSEYQRCNKENFSTNKI